MKKRVTLKQIARELEVSVSTVSKALKNSEEISRDTKDKIQAFAKLYNYRPNNIALSLKNKNTKNIGVIIPDIVHHFFTTVFRGIEQYAGKKGYNVMICVSDESFEKEVLNMELLANGSVDGFILSLSAETQERNDYNHIKEVLGQGIPVVLFDRVSKDVLCDKVILNDQEIAYEAVKVMIGSGKTKIALVTTENYFNVSSNRAQGFEKAIRDANLAFDENLILTLPYQSEGDELIRDFFESNTIDAVLCVNEIFAIKCMDVVQRQGKRVPEDISFIGFTNGILSKYSTPRLSTVAQHGERMGETAAKLLIDRIENDVDDNFRTEVISGTLIQRDSTIN
ncbi:LacI family DNA-binding transcriptional regulator [Maribacter cobaltidurans]|uniref:LacI family transcriptional regulator n=1 Tax=Maribacter cobaltidurans TaxID=1178778 RepID=A0A223V5W2_9FLAO|nr:LacI family DNA-binding transcriptional regulator [Maribacter cobaltidurans]ASV30587.1 LacI family transcriptional regulator [Maribacter cobaltidurans]GGD80035.1 LacI family transcriptional regulator [Maribacter cobaltidurans]